MLAVLRYGFVEAIYKMPRDVKSGTCVFYPTVLLWQQKYSADYQIHLLIFNIFFYPLWVLAEMNFNVSSCWNWQKILSTFKERKWELYISMQREPFNLLKNFTITFLPKKFSFLIFFFKGALHRHSTYLADLMKMWLWPFWNCQYLLCSSYHDSAMGWFRILLFHKMLIFFPN